MSREDDFPPADGPIKPTVLIHFDTNIPPFMDWVLAAATDIRHVQELCAQALADEPEQMGNQMKELAAWLERINFLFAQAKAHYYLAKKKVLVARQEGYTDLDRETLQKANISTERMVMDTLEGMVESLRMQLMLGMNLRKAYLAENTGGGTKDGR